MFLPKKQLGGGNSNILWNVHPYKYLGKILFQFDQHIFSQKAAANRSLQVMVV